MKCLVLCAGIGARVRPLSYYIHKSMLPLRDGRPALDHIVTQLERAGLKPVLCLSKGNHEEQIIGYFGKRCEYSITDKPCGTAGEIVHAVTFLKNTSKKPSYHRPEPFMVYYGDTLTDMDMKDLIKYHNLFDFSGGKFERAITVCAVKGLQSEFGVYLLSSDARHHNRVTKVIEKPVLPFNRNVPIFIFPHNVLPFMRPGKDLMKDIMPRLIKQFHTRLYIHKGKVLDMGKLSDYEKEVGL